MIQPFSFHHTCVFRTPSYSLVDICSSEEELKRFARADRFQEEIYLASPVLFDQLQSWLDGKITQRKEILKLITSIGKYNSRISSRCTPYGLFASCGTVEWGNNSKIKISSLSRRNTRLDMNFACGLINEIIKHPGIRQHILFYPNSTIYALGEKLRYVEYKISKNYRSHSISCVDASPYLNRILSSSKNGLKIEEIILLLQSMKIDRTSAQLFVDEIIDSQLLISELEPSLTGSDFLSELIATLNKIKSESAISFTQTLNRIDSVLKALDESSATHPQKYRELIATISELGVNGTEQYMFQVDSFSQVGTYQSTYNCIDQALQNKLASASYFLFDHCDRVPNTNLVSFKNRFLDRYEDAEVALSEVLDTETGIGYPAKDAVGINYLIDDLRINGSAPNNSFSYSQKDVQLLKLLIAAVKDGTYCVQLQNSSEKKDAKVLEESPATLAIMFRIINSTNGQIQLLQLGGGSSAANLLGRFAYGSEKILQIVKDITHYEKSIDPTRILAEIVHLPESRVGNILARPVLREYEIPYLAKSGASPDKQITLDDLVVSIRDNRILLRSKRLNKEVVPRLSTAHNYSAFSLPVYNFLCDLQTQDYSRPTYSFSWGALASSFAFLPRAEYDGVILYPATWNLAQEDYKFLCDGSDKIDFHSHLEAWRGKWKLPRMIVLKDGDNELFVDFENKLSVQTFFHEIKKRKFVQLSEFLFDASDSLIEDDQNKPHNNEIIAVVFNNASKPPLSDSQIKMLNTHHQVERSFLPGDDWLYYKFYSGIKTADDLLAIPIKNIINELEEKKLLDTWFFIRYSDQDTHVRLRILPKSASDVVAVMSIVSNHIRPWHKQGLIIKVQTDTYNRELERYGANSISLSERMFAIDSWATVNFLEFAHGDAGESLKWQYGICAIADLLEVFSFSTAEKINLLGNLSKNFALEHGGDKNLKLQLDNKFRKMRSEIEGIMANRKIFPANQLLEWRKANLEPLVHEIKTLQSNGKLSVSIYELAVSHSHMALNRLFKSRQRTHEMVIYDFLFRYYKSFVARTKKETKSQ